MFRAIPHILLIHFLASIATLLLNPGIGFAAKQSASQDELPRIFVVGTCMGPITYSVVVVDPPQELNESKLQSLVDDALDRVNRSMSTYLQDSDVSRFNRAADNAWVEVDQETALVVSRALEISAQTEGAFDITVGPAVKLWKFGNAKGEFKIPDDAAVQKVLSHVGYQKIEVRIEPPAIKKLNANVQIDLSAIAKGFAVDQVAQRLNDAGSVNYMVEVGGEVRCQGHRHTGGPWRLGIRDPDQPPEVPGVVIELSGRSLATSGDYENFHRVGKKRFSHTIDPATARPVKHFMASASIIAKDCMTADALATAAMVTGRDASRTMLGDLNVDYFLVERESAFGNDFSTSASESFPVVNRDIRELNSDEPNGETSASSFLPVFVASVVIFAIVIVAMAVGAIFNNKPVQGSCGGIASVIGEDGEASCSVCSKPTTDCVDGPWNAKAPADS